MQADARIRIIFVSLERKLNQEKEEAISTDDVDSYPVDVAAKKKIVASSAKRLVCVNHMAIIVAVMRLLSQSQPINAR